MYNDKSRVEFASTKQCSEFHMTYDCLNSKLWTGFYRDFVVAGGQHSSENRDNDKFYQMLCHSNPINFVFLLRGIDWVRKPSGGSGGGGHAGQLCTDA